MPLQIRRGLESDRTTIVPADGEMLYTTDNKTLFVGDGDTPGGNQVGGALDSDARTTAAAAFNKANSANILAQSSYSFANSVNVKIDSAYTFANTVNTKTDAAFSKANSANVIAQAGFDFANTVNVKIDSAYTFANTINTKTDAAFTKANSANTLAQAAFDAANAAGSSVFTQASFDKANSANVLAQSAFNKANSANVLAQSAYDTANLKFNTSGGTITDNVTITNGKDLTVTGNLYVQGNTISFNTSTLAVQDSLIVLAVGNYTTDALDIGIAGHYNNGSNAHTGIIRDSSNKEWYFFKGYTPELTGNNDIDITHSSFSTDNVNASYFKGNLIGNSVTVGGIELGSYTQSAYSKANSANTLAQSAYDKANSANIFTQSSYDFANSVNVKADSSYAFGNTVNVKVDSAYAFANTVNIKVDSVYAFSNTVNLKVDSAYAWSNTINVKVDSVYNFSNTVNIKVDSAYAFANAVNIKTDSAFTKANAANVLAQSAYDTANLKFNTSGGTITGDTIINANISVTGANVSLGNVANVHIYGGNTGQVISTDNFGNLSFIDLPSTNTITYTAASISLTNGVYVSGSVTDIQVLNDGNYYSITDGSNTGPAWIITTTFTGVTSFNRVVSNIDYTLASGHTVYFQLYNYVTAVWDNIGSYSGASGYSQYALEVLGYASYISGGTVQARLYHSNTGNVSHATKLDYFALEKSSQGAQGPRGPTGATGATGATGNGVSSGGTTGQILVKNSSTNYDTIWVDNLAYVQANAAFDKANSANVLAQAAFDYANTVNVKVDSVYAFANIANIKVDSAYAFSNIVNVKVDSAYTWANTINVKVDSAYAFANIANIKVDSAYAFANIVNTKTDAAFAKANVANTIAQSAYDTANLKFNTSGGNITDNVFITNGKDLTVTGNLYVQGNTVSINTSTLAVQDSLIVLAVGNYTTDTLDIGFAGHYNNGANAHTGLIRDSGNKEWYLFKGYTPELDAGNNIDITHASFATDNVNASYFKGNLIANTATVGGVNLLTFSQAGFDKANAANILAQSAYTFSNTVNVKVDSAYAFANTANITAQAAFDKANAANIFAQSAYAQANLDVTSLTVTTGVFGNASIVPVVTVLANGRVSSVTNTTIAISTAQITSGVLPFAQGGTNASSYTTGALLTSNGTSIISLANTGTAGTYGNATYVPVITTDAYGRVTSVTNTAITGISAGSTNSFSTILVSGQPNVIANTSTSPLTLVAGANMTITTDGTSNTITFASTGGSGSFTGGAVTGNTQFTNTSVSTSNTTGAVTISGGLGVSGNVYTGSHVITGNSANGLTFTDNTKLTTAYAMSIVASQGWFLP